MTDAQKLKEPERARERIRDMKILVGALALVLTACGAPSDREALQAAGASRQAEPTPFLIDPEDPCDLLEPEDVGEAIGYEVDRESEVDSKDGSVRLCAYRTTEPFGSVVTYLEPEVSEEEFRERMRKDPMNAREVKDIGDAAFIHAGSSIQILVDGTAVSVSVQMFDSVDHAEIALRNVGNLAVERLRP